MSLFTDIFPSFHRFPDAIAIQAGNQHLSFKSLQTLIEKRSLFWQKHGLLPGDKIALPASPSLECLLDLFAIWNCQGIVCPLNPRLPPHAKENLLQRLAPVIFWDGSHLVSIPGDNAISLPIATLLFTSGTTATPKIAAHTFDNFLISSLHAALALHLGPGDSWHLALPLYHVSGLSILFRCLISGATLLLSEASIISPSTHFSLVPTQLFRILHNPELLHFYQKARCIVIGGAPLTNTLYQEALQARLPLAATWGMTETTAMATLGLSPTVPLHCGSCLPHIEISFFDEEIRVRSPSIFAGYLENGRIIPAYDAEGWFYTRDRGTFTPQKQLLWLGRKDLMFTCGGENIQPEEIEQILGNIPGIVDAIVVPLEDQEFGALPAAFIRFLSSTYDENQLRYTLAHYLPRFKIPRYFFPFPDSTIESSKPNRHMLKEAMKVLVKSSSKKQS